MIIVDTKSCPEDSPAKVLVTMYYNAFVLCRDEAARSTMPRYG